MSERLPEFFVVIAVVAVVAYFVRGEVVFGLFLGALWLIAAYVQYRRRERRGTPQVPSEDRP